MPRLGPVRRDELIKYLRALGFEGPYSGRKHQFMIKGEVRLRIPNPHQGDIGKELLPRILRQGKTVKGLSYYYLADELFIRRARETQLC